MLCVDTRLGRKHRSYESLNLVILILRRSSGQGFRVKDPRLPRLIKPRSFDGKITVRLFLGITLFVVEFVYMFVCFNVDVLVR